MEDIINGDEKAYNKSNLKRAPRGALFGGMN